MTPEQKRIAIAEACPVVVCKNISGQYVWRENQSRFFDPFADLNAMHEAEKVLISRNICELRDYVHKLHSATNGWPSFATAAQRAEAFGLTLELW